MSNKFNLDDYIPVWERLLEAKSKVSQIISEQPVMVNDVLGYIRVTLIMTDERKATAIGSFRLDATSHAKKTNPLEDAETSALGRCLAFLGYNTSRSIASREEVEIAQERDTQPPINIRTKAQRAIVTMMDKLEDNGVEFNQPHGSLLDMPYDNLVEYGKYLRSIIQEQSNA